MPPDSISELADRCSRFHEEHRRLPDPFEAKVVPSRLLVSETAHRIFKEITNPQKQPRPAFAEWVASWSYPHVGRDFDAHSLKLRYPLEDCYGWSIAGIVPAAAAFPWGVTCLGSMYHDYSANYDVEWARRHAGLQLSLAWDMKADDEPLILPQADWSRREAQEFWAGVPPYDELPAASPDAASFTWPVDADIGGTVARIIDSRQYGTRTQANYVPEEKAEAFLDYYVDKARRAVIAIEDEAPDFVIGWDRANRRDQASGYTFEELKDPAPSVEAVLLRKHQSINRKRDAEQTNKQVNAEVSYAFYQGDLEPGEYALPDIGKKAKVYPPSGGKNKKTPLVKFFDLDGGDNLG